MDFIDTATNTDLGSFPLSAGVATLTATPIGRGIHLYLVIYSGDSHFARSSSYLMVTVAGYSSDTTASTSSSNPVFGQTVMLTATVQPASPSSILPTGSVDFYDETDGIDLGVVPLSSGVATLTTNSLSIGNLTIQVLYLGDLRYDQSVDYLNLTVSMDTTTSQPSVSPHPANIDQPVTIRPNAPGSRIPTGILDFFLALESSSATVPAGPGPSRLNTAPASEIARSEAVAPQLRSKVTISLASDADGASEEFSDLIDSGALNDVAVGVAATLGGASGIKAKKASQSG